MKAATPHFLLAPNRPAAITPTAIRAAAVTPGPDILKSPPRARCARHRRPPHTAAQDSNRLEFSGPRLRYDHRGAHFSHLRFSDVRLVSSLSEAANDVAPEALTLLPLQACSCALTRVSRRAAPVPCLRAAASFPRLPLPLPLPLMPLTRPHPSPPLPRSFPWSFSPLAPPPPQPLPRIQRRPPQSRPPAPPPSARRDRQVSRRHRSPARGKEGDRDRHSIERASDWGRAGVRMRMALARLPTT